MDEAEPWRDVEVTAMRAILLDWGNLSRGDIGIISQCVREPAAMALTVRGSAHARFWRELVTIGWAEQLYSPIDPYDHDPEPQAFRLAPGGERPLSHFLVFYDLLNMGACTPEIDARMNRAAAADRDTPPSASALREPPALVPARFARWAWTLVALFLAGVAVGRASSG